MTMDFFLDNLETIVRILDETTNDTGIRDVEKKIADLGFRTEVDNLFEFSQDEDVNPDSEFITVYINDDDDFVIISNYIVSYFSYTTYYKPYRKEYKGGYIITSIHIEDYPVFYVHGCQWTQITEYDSDYKGDYIGIVPTEEEMKLVDTLNSLVPQEWYIY